MTPRSVRSKTCRVRGTRSSPSAPTSSMPAVSMKSTGPIGRSSIGFSTGSVVVPATSETIETFCRVSAFSSDDLPTFRRPKMPMCSRKLLGVPRISVVFSFRERMPQPHDAFGGDELVECSGREQAASRSRSRGRSFRFPRAARATSVAASYPIRSTSAVRTAVAPSTWRRQRASSASMPADAEAPEDRAGVRAAGPGCRAARRRPAAGTGSAPGCPASTPARWPGRWPSPPWPPARRPPG